MQPSQGNQRPDLLTSLMNMSLALRLPRKMHLCRSYSNVPRLPPFLEMLQNSTFCLFLTRCTIPCACHAKRHLNVQKCSVPVSFLHFWLENFPHKGVHFFDMSISKSGPRMVCLVHFDLEMCFAPQRRGGPNVRFFYILTSKRASRHNGVQFFISHLARWLHTRHFSEPTLRPSGATNHWKNTTFRDFSTFSRTCIFFLLALSLLWSYLFFSSLLWLFPPLLFRLSTLSEVWLLNFLRLCRCICIYIYISV